MAVRKLAFVLSLGFIFVVPWEGVIEYPGLGSLAKLIGIATGGVWIVSIVVTNRFRKPEPFHVVVALFVLWNALSLFWSGDPGQTMLHVRTWVQLLGMVLILWDLYTTREAIMTGLQAFILGEYVCIANAVQHFLAGDVYYNTYQRFSPAEQSNPDGFGFIVVLGLPVAWYLATSMKLKSPRWESLWKIVNYAYIPVGFIGLSLSGTRTALIASFVGVAYGLSSLNRLRVPARVAIFGVVAAAIFLLLPRVQTLKSFQRFGTTYTELTEGTLNNRTNNWAEGLAAVPENPVLGVGTNRYRSVNSQGKLAHNSFISVLVELGIIGLALFGIAVAIALYRAWTQPKWDSRFWLAVLLVWGLGANALTYEHRKATWLFLSLSVAAAAATRAERKREESESLEQGEEEARVRFAPRRRLENLPQGG